MGYLKVRAAVVTWLLFTAAVLAPFFALGLYLWLTRSYVGSSEFGDVGALFLSLAIGGLLVLLLPVNLGVRFMVLLPYLVVEFFMLLSFAFSFVCAVYRDCL